MSTRWLVRGLGVSVALLTAGLIGGGVALAAEKVNWLTGTAFRNKLQQRESLGWSGRPLRDAFEGFARAQRLAIVIDRRVDPGQPLEASLAQMPISELLISVAEERGLGVSFFEPVLYIGPPNTVRRLRTIVAMRKEELNQLPNAQRLAWVQARTWQWDDLATPRELLGQLGKEGKFEIEGLDAIPHDLWAGVDLPPLGMVERLSLVLAQYDLTFSQQGPGKIKLEPMLAEVWMEKSYNLAGKPEEVAGKLAAALPGADVRVEKGKVVVRGLVEQHEQIEAGSVKTTKPAVAADEPLERRTFTLTATNKPVRTVLEFLKQQLGLDLRVDAEKLRQSGKSLDMLISVSVKDARIDATLKAVLDPAGLKFRREDKVVHIEAADGQ